MATTATRTAGPEGGPSPSAVTTANHQPVFQIGDLVDVRPRTWAGINKPGGTGRIVQLHISAGFLEAVDVNYVIGTRKDKKVDLEFCTPHQDLQRGGRSRRGRDFFTASPARGGGEGRGDEGRGRRNNSSRQRRVAVTAEDTENQFSRLNLDKGQSRKKRRVGIRQRRGKQSGREEDCPATNPIIVATPLREILLNKENEDLVSPLKIPDTVYLPPKSSEQTSLSQSDGSGTTKAGRGGESASIQVKSLLVASFSSKGVNKNKDSSKPTEKKIQAVPSSHQNRSIASGTVKLSFANRPIVFTKATKRKKSPMRPRRLPLQSSRKTVSDVTPESCATATSKKNQETLEETKHAIKPLRQVYETVQESARDFVKSIVAKDKHVQASQAAKLPPVPPSPNADESRMSLLRSIIWGLFPSSDDVLDRQNLLMNVNAKANVGGETYSTNEVNTCLHMMEGSGLIQIDDDAVYRI